jgi:hypothetical protein
MERDAPSATNATDLARPWLSSPLMTGDLMTSDLTTSDLMTNGRMPSDQTRTRRRVPTTTLAAILLLGAALPAQDWTDAQLVERAAGFHQESLVAHLQQVSSLLADRDRAMTSLVARIHGDHREYRLKVDRLLDELAAPDWRTREAAERTLIEIGGRAWNVIQQKKDEFDVLEQRIRCGRILDALAAKGTENEERELRLMRGLVRTALYYEPSPRLTRALRSALGHTDSTIAAHAIRALGRHGGDEDTAAVAQMLGFKGGVHRTTAASALARMPSPAAVAVCRTLLLGGELPAAIVGVDLTGITLDRADRVAIVRTLRTREDEPARALLRDLAAIKDQAKNPGTDPVVAAAARATLPTTAAPVPATLMLPDRGTVEAPLVELLGDSTRVGGAFSGLEVAELSHRDCATFEFPAHPAAPATLPRVFLNQGSLVAAEVLGVDQDHVRVRSPVFGDVTLPRKDVQGLAFDPKLDRLVGASVDHDRVRLRDGGFVDGRVEGGGGSFRIALQDGAARDTRVGDVAGIMFTRPRVPEVDPTSYTRVDLVTGERLFGFVAASSPSHVAVVVPAVGAATLPWTSVRRVEFGVGGGAMWGFTLIADYSDNKIVEVDDLGRVGFVLEDVFGAWDAECLDSGNLLIVEFSVSRVQEVDRQGKTVWAYENLKNPYDADRLPNGNTLIADTFAGRVIEVDKAGTIVWSFANDIRPFDCDRLPNGNTLVTDALRERVIEVAPDGSIVWEIRNLPQAHDADRLPNGNTLITLRTKGSVIEIDRDGKVVFEINGLSSPSDADRLPNGNTLVAENIRVREFDRNGNVVWEHPMTWAVEVNRY